MHNGLGGIATGLYSLVRLLIDEGAATGRYDEATMDAVAPGGPLRDYLAAETSIRFGQSIEIDGVRQTSGAAAAALIDPGGKYHVSYIEV